MVASAAGTLEAEGWTGFISSNDVSSIWADGDFVYWGSSGGVVIRDRSTSAEEKLLKEPGGLVSNRVVVVVRDEQGRLWMGTKDSGVCVLTGDGKWQFHNTGNLHLLSNQVTDIATFDNRTVVATTGGISLFEEGEFRTWFDGRKWATSGCSSVGGVALNGQEVLVGAGCGLFSYQLDTRTWKAVVADPGGYRIAYDGTEMFWAIDTIHKIIYAYDGFTAEIMPKTFIVNDSLRDIAALDSIVWVVTHRGPARFNHPARLWQYYRSNIEDITTQVYRVQVATDSSVWLGTDVAAASLVDSAWVIMTSQGPPGNYVEDLEVDAAGHVWCATGTRGGGVEGGNIGVMRYDGFSWDLLAKPEMPSNRAYCIDGNPVDGSIWMGYWEGGVGDLVRYDLGTGEIKLHGKRLKSRFVSDIYIDEDGRVVFGQYLYGIGVICEGDSIVYYSRDDDEPRIQTVCPTVIGPGPGGSYLIGVYIAPAVGCDAEVTMLDVGGSCVSKDDDSGTSWTSFEGWAEGFAYDIEMDIYGVVWLATSGGLSCYDGTWHRVMPVGGVGSVWDIEVDSFGTKWVGTDNGLYVLKGFGVEWDHFERDYQLYDAANSPLEDAPVKAMDFDSDGRLWIGTGGGGVYS